MTLAAAAARDPGPYVPQRDDEVLAELPASAPPRLRRDRSLSAEAAARLAQVYIERARESGDPRELGYAQGLLQPWWTQTAPPDAILLMRATLRQSQHHFDAALTDLDQLLARNPRQPQARLTRATVLRVLGRYPEARAACPELVGDAQPLVSDLCRTSIDGLAGQADSAAASLEAWVPRLATAPRTVQLWYWAERGDLAERRGDVAGAESAYGAGLRLAPTDIGLRAALADLHLMQGQPAKALGVLQPVDRVDALRLREALALQALQDPRAQAVAALLRDSFAASRNRGEQPHLREETRFVLEYERQPARALPLALQNWAVQREPADLRLVFEAARAAGQPEAAAEARAWLSASGFADVRLGLGR